MSELNQTQTTPPASAPENSSEATAQPNQTEVRPGQTDVYVDPSLDRSTVQPGTAPPPAKQRNLKYDSYGDAERALLAKQKPGEEKPSISDIATEFYSEFMEMDAAGAEAEAKAAEQDKPTEKGEPEKEPEPSVLSPDVQALKDQIGELIAMQQQVAQQSQQVMQTGDAPTDPNEVARRTLEYYMENIPMEFVQRIQNMENPADAQQALSALIGAGLARVDMTLRGDLNATVEQLKAELSQQIPQSMTRQQMEAASRQAVWNDLLSAHADLNKPAILDALPGVVRRYVAEKGLDPAKAQYSAAVRDEIASRARAELGLPQPAAQPKSEETKAPPQKTQQRAPYMAPAANTRTYTPPDPEQDLLDRVSKVGP